jgi:predicted alpha/beta-fold hydrolase
MNGEPEPTSGEPMAMRPLLDGLVCISSPLDLVACSAQIERPRNRVYERWLLRRLLAQTADDPFGILPAEADALAGRGPIGPLRTIRDFDAAITAPRWGYGSVEAYYRAASPLPQLLALGDAQQLSHLPPALIVHAADDPWVPVSSTERLAASPLATGHGGPWEVLITAAGGHNGFHARCDDLSGVEPGNWGDRLTARWLRRQTGAVA